MTGTWRSLLDYLTGEDVLERVRGILQRHLAAHLDLGLAAWRNPLRRQGFFAAWRASAGQDLALEMDELPNVRDEILNLPDDPLAVLADELPAPGVRRRALVRLSRAPRKPGVARLSLACFCAATGIH